MTTINSLSTGINAYRDVAGLRRLTATEQTAATTAGQSAFTTALKDAAEAAVQSLRDGEQKSKEGIAGQVDVREVVMAVNNAEITLQTVVAVRDKVIQAYQEIMRMPI